MTQRTISKRGAKTPDPARTKAAREAERNKPTIKGKARPHYVSRQNVWDAALERIRWLFDEFDGNVSVSNSGGKDSTVVLELAAIVAKERGQKLRVMWLDQECEFDATVEHQRWLLNERDDIDFEWYQIPFRLFNATNHEDEWLNVWGEGEDWVRPKEPNTIHENDFYKGRILKDGTDKREKITRFKELLGAINGRTGGAILTGMRAEESPGRRIFMISNPVYKWVTWGSRVKEALPNDAFLFHPIYDWTYLDVWAAIERNGWRYNSMYDTMYRYGVPTRAMRVSNYSHSQSTGALLYLQEAEPETWEKATRRLGGLSTQGHLGRNSKMIESNGGLPYMFKDWHEYMHHLIDHLITEKHRDKFRHMFTSIHTSFPEADTESIARNVVVSVMLNDYTWTTINQFVMNLRQTTRRQGELDALDKIMTEAQTPDETQEDEAYGQA